VSRLSPSPDAACIIRQLTAADAPSCRLFFRSLDREDIRLRFASLHPPLDALASRAATGLAFGALDASGMLLGIADLVDLPAGSAEVALAIRSDRKRRGLGRSLLAHAIRQAEGRGLSLLLGYVLGENAAMLCLAREMGFRSRGWEGASIEVARPIGDH
jgi:acetyltransferase